MNTLDKSNRENTEEWSHDSPVYKAKINSAGWKKKSKEALTYYGKFCRACNSTEQIDIHHLLYGDSFGGQEKLEDLIPLCRTCHEEVHLLYKKEHYHPKNHTIRMVTSDFIDKRNIELNINRNLDNITKNDEKVFVKRIPYNKAHIKQYIRTLHLSVESERDANILANLYSIEKKKGELNVSGSEMQKELANIWIWKNESSYTIAPKAERAIFTKLGSRKSNQIQKQKRKKSKNKKRTLKRVTDIELSNIKTHEIKAYIDSKKLNPPANKLAKEIANTYDKSTNTAKSSVRTKKTQRYLNSLFAGIWSWSSLDQEGPKLSKKAHLWIYNYRSKKSSSTT